MVDGALHVGQVGFTPMLESAADPTTGASSTFDAPLAPEENEITARGTELTLSLTDLQIPTGYNTGEKAVKPIICGVNYTRRGTTCLV